MAIEKINGKLKYTGEELEDLRDRIMLAAEYTRRRSEQREFCGETAKIAIMVAIFSILAIILYHM